MEEKICSFFGHRTLDGEAEGALSLRLTDALREALALGCHIFYFGGFGDFDELCYFAVRDIKKEQPHLALKMVFCVPQERYLRRLPPYLSREDYDDIIYLAPALEGWYRSIFFRNCAMIDQSDFVVFYADEREGSGAYKTYRYALKQKKRLVNLYPQDR